MPLRFIEISLPGQTFYLLEQEFDVQWVHSVEKEEWIESYELIGNKLLLTTTAFKTFGAGVPSDGIIEVRNDGFVHMKINREMDEILLVVSHLVKTTVQFKGKVLPLYEIVDDYEEVQIQSKWVPWWAILI